jgi:DNA-binding CsgD family transcriptional regulator
VSTVQDLSPRVQEVAVLVADGKTNKEVARVLKITEATVKVHLKSAFRDLGVRNRTEVAILMKGFAPPVQRPAASTVWPAVFATVYGAKLAEGYGPSSAAQRASVAADEAVRALEEVGCT